MGDRDQEDQPPLSEPGIWIPVVVPTVAPALALVPLSQDAAQPHPYPWVETFWHVLHAAAEGICPSPRDRVDPLDDGAHVVSVVALGPCAHTVFELLDAFPARPFVASFKEFAGCSDHAIGQGLVFARDNPSVEVVWGGVVSDRRRFWGNLSQT